MKTIVQMTAVAMLIALAAPAYADDVMQVWACEMDDDATEEQVLVGAAKWIKAAKKVKGGENFEVAVYFPIAVNATGNNDCWLTIHAPSFEEWGKFWDNYDDSVAADIEETNEEWVVCPDSLLWEKMDLDLD